MCFAVTTVQLCCYPRIHSRYSAAGKLAAVYYCRVPWQQSRPTANLLRLAYRCLETQGIVDVGATDGTSVMLRQLLQTLPNTTDNDPTAAGKTAGTLANLKDRLCRLCLVAPFWAMIYAHCICHLMHKLEDCYV